LPEKPEGDHEADEAPGHGDDTHDLLAGGESTLAPIEARLVARHRGCTHVASISPADSGF
jgi:hypothetical protein